jgi:hypothetical protein
MALQWIFSSADVDWEELSALYLASPLGYKDPADLQVAFSNSMFKCFAYESGRLIAAGRALADGKDCSYICDMAMHPTHQGRGLGSEIVSTLVLRWLAIKNDKPKYAFVQSEALPAS